MDRAIAGSASVEFRAFASHECLENYALGALPVQTNLLDAARDADVVHLHHAYVADDVIPMLRSELPRAKIVVTLHGEPDRSRGHACRGEAPDAYHVVDPGLKQLCAGAPCTFVPNHPTTEPVPPRRSSLENPQLLVPFSHVAQHKDRVTADAAGALLERAGWHVVRRVERARNEVLRALVADARATWVHLQGYLDLLTMECWQAGSIPIVARPDGRLYAEWCEALGFQPDLPFERGAADAIVATLHSKGADASIAHNREGMARSWTMARCRDAWERFYASVA